MTLDSTLTLIMAEVLLAMVLAAAAFFFVWRNKRNKETAAINSFLNQLEDHALLKNQPLDRLLRETCGFDPRIVRESLQDVSASERELMQKVIQLFLQREMLLLNEIDRCIGKLSEPYCQLLSKLANEAKPVNDDNTQKLEQMNRQLTEQLDTAMQTIDEITNEYTRVFNGHQTELELENSSKKMLQIYQDSIHHLKQSQQN